MDPNPLGLTLGLPLTATVGEVSDQLLLLGVDADGGLAVLQKLRRLLVQVAELGVTIGVLFPFGDFGVGPQGE